MEVRKELCKSTWKGDAMTKSPTKILAAANKLSQETQEFLTTQQVSPTSQPDDVVKPTQPQPMETQESFPPALAPGTSKASGDEDDDDEEDGDLLEETDADEESVDISVTSSTTTTNESRLNVTDQYGKLDLSKIRGWSIPKLKKPDVLHQSTIRDRTPTNR